MPDDTITLVSTTDTAEEVQAALGAPPENPPPETPSEKPDEQPTEPDESPEQKEARESKEASEAGSRLAKRRQSIQAEIDELTGRKYHVRRDVEAEEARLAELRQQRQSFETSKPAADTPPAAPGGPSGAQPAGKPAEGRPEPKLDDVDDKGNAKYANYEEFLSDQAKWSREEAALVARRIVDEERQAERARIEQDSASRVVNEHLANYNTSLEEFKKTHADFDAVFEEAKAQVQDALVALGPQALKVIDGYTVFDAEDGPALTYYFLKNPEELKAVAMKPPHQQLVHLARLEAQLRHGHAKPSGPSPKAAPVTRAPEPIKPVGSGPTATTVPLDEASYQDYKLQRERDIRARRAG